jgi:tetratricopeptide (TPR) repeat protein
MFANTTPAACNATSQANLACGDFETALKDFDIALQHNTDNPEFPYYRGLVFEVMGNHESARTWFNQALLRSTEYFPALLHAALVLHSTKMFKESIKRFEIALMIQPHRADVKEARGRVLQVTSPTCHFLMKDLKFSNASESIAYIAQLRII